MLSIEMRRRPQRNEELRSIRIGTRIRHGERSFALVLEGGHEFVFEFRPVDATAAAAGARRVAALDHEAFDDAVEDYVVVFAGVGEGGEVFAGLYRCFC